MPASLHQREHLEDQDNVPPMSAEWHKPTRSFGAGDHKTCPKCGKVMSLSRRTPHSEHGDAYERQTFTCRECGHDIERSADKRGMPHK
jgi:predicted RNA-binding Zn-ribbon protein involved in translation (DUF1610 family)